MPQDQPDYFGLVLVALVNLMFNGEHRLSFKNGVDFLLLRQLRRGLDIVRRLAPWPDSPQAHARAADDGLPRICVLPRYPVERSEPRRG